MGIAEVIPGVSGGTIAFITGIYERLLLSIRSFNPGLINVWKSDGFRSVLKAIDAGFLMRLFAGMAIGFVLGLKAIIHLLDHHPLEIWSFFFGLILASIPLVARQITTIRWKEIILFVLGTAFVYWVTIAAPSQGSEKLILVFLSGVLAISAMMLPGLSGSFVLLLLGMYTIIMPAISAFISTPFGPETTMLLVFGLGVLTGVFTFARVLSWTFARFKNQTLALLCGFLLGSLNKVWPWQEVLRTRTNSKGEMKVMFSKSISPIKFEQLDQNFLYGTDPRLWTCLLIMGASIVLILILERLGRKTG
jgi:putative membrane protein